MEGSRVVATGAGTVMVAGMVADTTTEGHGVVGQRLRADTALVVARCPIASRVDAAPPCARHGHAALKPPRAAAHVSANGPAWRYV